MKGQSKFIEFALTALFSMLVLVSLSALIYSFYRAALEQEVKGELKQISIQVADALIKLHDVAKNSKISPSNYTSALVSEVGLKLPANVANLNYEVNLIAAKPIYATIASISVGGVNVSTTKEGSGAKVIAKTTQDPKIAYEYDLPNFDVTVQGKIKNGLDGNLRYYRYNENAILFDTIILGQPDMIIKITSVG